MFFTYYKENEVYHNLRAVTYELSPADLRDIIGKYEEIDNENTLPSLKVYLACNENYDPGKIMEDSPAFSPFVQLNLTGSNPTIGFENCYLPAFRKKAMTPVGTGSLKVPTNNPSNFSEPTKIKTIPNTPLISTSDVGTNVSQISPNSAHLFIDEWCQIDNSEIQGLFSGTVQGQVARLNSFSFLKEDIEKIAEISNANPESSLFLHLAVIKPNIQSAFGFHVVLEIAEFSDTETRIGDSTYLEFGYPCPPYCKGLGED